MDLIRVILVLIIGIDLTLACIAIPIAVYLDLRERSSRKRCMKIYIPMQLITVFAVLGFWRLAAANF